MTHPLTDKVCDQLTDELDEIERFFGVEDCMRSAADWQLEQVIKVWEQCMEESGTDIQVIRRFEQKLKAMRPTQEDN